MSQCKYCGKEVEPGYQYDSELCRNLYWLRYKERDLAIPGKRPTAMGAWEYIRDAALKFSGGRCECCGKDRVDLAEEFISEAQDRGEWVSPNLPAQMNFFEVHHIIPLHLGGNSSLDNLIVLCKRCHLNAHAEIRISERLRTRNETTLEMYAGTVRHVPAQTENYD